MKGKTWLPLLSVPVLLAADQASKAWAAGALQEKGGREVFKGVFSLTYVENTGMAFGLFQGSSKGLVLVCLGFLAFLVWLYRRLPAGKHAFFARLSLLLVAAGGIGNMADRVFKGYVVDFLYFSLIDFPVFNLADCYVVIGGILLVFLL